MNIVIFGVVWIIDRSLDYVRVYFGAKMSWSAAKDDSNPTLESSSTQESTETHNFRGVPAKFLYEAILDHKYVRS